MKTTSQVCIELEAATDIDQLIALQQEVRANLKKYPGVELLYMDERMGEAARRIARRDAEELREVLSNWAM